PKRGQPEKTASLSGKIKDDQWKNLGFGLDTFNGTKGDVALTVQLWQAQEHTAELTASMDMGAAQTHIGLLSWDKPAGAPAVLKVAATLEDGKDTQIKTIDMSGPQLKVKGNAIL